MSEEKDDPFFGPPRTAPTTNTTRLANQPEPTLEEQDVVTIPDASGRPVTVPATFLPASSGYDSPDLMSAIQAYVSGQVPNAIGERNYEDSLAALSDDEVLCTRCRHGHIIDSFAATGNRKPDGSPFVQKLGWCLTQQPPLELAEIRPYRCTRFQPIDPTKETP